MKKPASLRGATVLFVLAIMALVLAPFLIWGEDYVRPLLQSQAERTGLLVLLSILLLAADSVAPVPSTLVLMFLAARAGAFVGVLAGTLGLVLGVWAAAWFGRVAVGRIAPRFFPEAELNRLRNGLERNLALTLACWRGVPVLAETSVILAAAAGVPSARLVRVTLLPNFIIALVYSLAADDSFATACLAFFLVLALSLLAWRLFGRRK